MTAPARPRKHASQSVYPADGRCSLA